MSKTKTFIKGTQLGTGRFTIKPQKVPFQVASTMHRPTKQLIGDFAAGKPTPNGKAMNEGRFSVHHIGPEFSIFELELNHAGNFTVAFS